MRFSFFLMLQISYRKNVEIFTNKNNRKNFFGRLSLRKLFIWCKLAFHFQYHSLFEDIVDKIPFFSLSQYKNMQELLHYCCFLRLLTIKFYVKSHQHSRVQVNHTALVYHTRRRASKSLAPLIGIVFFSNHVLFGIWFHLGPVL